MCSGSGLGAWRAPKNERGEEILRVCRALAEPGHLVDVVLGRDIARRYNDLELDIACEIEDRGFVAQNSGPLQEKIEIRPSLSLLSIVDDSSSTKRAQVSCYRPVLVVEGEGEVEATDARQLFQG